jgi:cytochrome c-type biogenesis protein CcmH
MISRRSFVTQLLGGSAAVAVGARMALAQQGQPAVHDSVNMNMMRSNLFTMNQSAARTIDLPPKPNAKPSMTPDERDMFEHQIRCQCGCTLDVYTCRTTDFSCQVSPAMHRDVMGLVEGGYSAQEILNAFVNTYGERVLMSPKRSGFNLVGWFAPGVTVLVGAGIIARVIVRWRRRTAPEAVERPARAPQYQPLAIDATPEELARVAAAVRSEDDRA